MPSSAMAATAERLIWPPGTADTPPGPVSVVGDFNDWQPGAHTLRLRRDGRRAVTVELPSKSTHSFRYLAAGDYWFNVESAGDHDGPNSRLHT
ncbi:isoamylase early set domain-containing protein [Streptomyces virginiae]